MHEPWNRSGRVRQYLTGRRGSTLLYVILALVLLGGLAAGITLLSPSAMQSKLQQEAAQRAFYNAQAGLNYILSMQKLSENSLDANQFVANMMGDFNVVTYSLSNRDKFSFSLKYDATNTNSYIVSYVMGEIGKQAQYTLAANKTISYTKGGGGGDGGGGDGGGGAVKGKNYAQSIGFSGIYYGNYIFESADFNGGVVINGSLDYVGTGENSYGDTCLHLVGSSIGLSDGSSHICSNTCIILDGGATYYGPIYSQGDVIVQNGTVYGNIYAGGDVSVTWSGHVNGDIYVHGKYTTASNTLVSGTIHRNASIPDKCTSYSLPEHEYYSSSDSIYLDYTAANNWSGEMTIPGVQDIDDHTYTFNSIYTKGGTKLCLDLSQEDTYINLFVTGNVELNGNIYVKTIAGEDCFQTKNLLTQDNFTTFAYSDYASRIYMDVNGSVAMNGGSDWLGTIYSKGNISIGGGSTIVGALYTNQALNNNMSGGLRLKYVESDYVAKNWPE